MAKATNDAADVMRLCGVPEPGLPVEELFGDALDHLGRVETRKARSILKRWSKVFAPDMIERDHRKFVEEIRAAGLENAVLDPAIDYWEQYFLDTWPERIDEVNGPNVELVEDTVGDSRAIR